MNGDTPTEEEVLVGHLESYSLKNFEGSSAENEQALRDLPEGSRQILKVEKYAMINGSWIVSTANPLVGSIPSIRIDGSPTPSSDATNAYLYFVDASALKRPSYSAAHKRINLYLDIRSIRMTIEQLKHSHQFIWVGHFAGGHLYGDFHSAP